MRRATCDLSCICATSTKISDFSHIASNNFTFQEINHKYKSSHDGSLFVEKTRRIINRTTTKDVYADPSLMEKNNLLFLTNKQSNYSKKNYCRTLLSITKKKISLRIKEHFKDFEIASRFLRLRKKSRNISKHSINSYPPSKKSFVLLRYGIKTLKEEAIA